MTSQVGSVGAINKLAAEPDGGLITLASALVTQKRDLIVFSQRSRLPTIFGLRYYAEAGGLARIDPHSAGVGTTPAVIDFKVAALDPSALQQS